MYKQIKALILILLFTPMLVLAHAERSPTSCYFFSYPWSYCPTQRLTASFMTEDFFAWDSFLELEDGTRWFFDYSDKHKIYRWYPEDAISITQNTSWFGRHRYTLVNHTRGDSIDVTLTRGPRKGDPLHHFIIAIDPINRLVVLNDRTTWEVHSDDLLSFRNWALHDTILIGHNSKWGSSGYEELLINVNMDNDLRARK